MKMVQKSRVMDSENNTVLTEIFGNSPPVRILDFFLDNKLFDFSKSEIAREIGMSKVTVHKYIDALLRLGILKENRKIGRASMYKLNLESPLVKKLMEIEDILIKKGYEESLLKVSTP